MKMVFEELLDFPACMFCLKSRDESELIEMNSNSIFLGDEIIEFSDLIVNLFNTQVPLEQSSMICEECKNLLVQFHIFKGNVQNNSLFNFNNKQNDEVIKKVKTFLDENEGEEVFCLRYNKCLTLVPESKRSFMEIFKHLQPHVVLDMIAEIPSPLSKKRLKLDRHVEREDVEETLESIVIVRKFEEVEEEFINEGYLPEVKEEEWLKVEMGNSGGVVETVLGEVDTWICRHCVPEERFYDEEDFRNHLNTLHFDYDQEGHDEDDNDGRLNPELDLHEKFHQDVVQESSEDSASQPNLLSCTMCDFSTEKSETLRLHKKKHLNMNVNSKLMKSARFEKLFCIDCSYQFISQAHYQAHVNGHQIYEIVAKHSTFPICELCNMMFCDDSLANIHHNKHEVGAIIEEAIPCQGYFLKYGHYREEEEEFYDNSQDENALKCGHCLKKFGDEESCRLHQLIFHVKELKCPIESRVFNGNQAFNIHLRNNHPELFGDVKFTCSVCKTEFATLYDKLKHMKTCDKKKFQCSHCDKKFSQKCYLKTHLKQVSGEMSVACEVCQKVCRDKGDYQIHFRSHSNIKPYKCSICPKAYKTSSARAAHLETHMEKGFDCSMCSTKFKSRRTLQKHVKTKHQFAEIDSNLEKIIIEEVIESF